MSNWKYTDATNTIVSRVNANGSVESCRAEAIENGTVISPAQEPSIESVIAGYIVQLQAFLDQAAQAKGYDDIKSAALRAGYPGPFHDEGVKFAIWMDACWSTGLTLLNEFQANMIPKPTLDQVLTALPPAPGSE